MKYFIARCAKVQCSGLRTFSRTQVTKIIYSQRAFLLSWVLQNCVSNAKARRGGGGDNHTIDSHRLSSIPSRRNSQTYHFLKSSIAKRLLAKSVQFDSQQKVCTLTCAECIIALILTNSPRLSAFLNKGIFDRRFNSDNSYCLIFGSIPPRSSNERWRTFSYAYAKKKSKKSKTLCSPCALVVLCTPSRPCAFAYAVSVLATGSFFLVKNRHKIAML